ncbi:MAG: rod shape-determining protein MreC [Candidatus Eremiobacteraeota bacterium]|nr:rod shape-determining protein MreC [Candidatus Eremiobacteraeota bacterium]
MIALVQIDAVRSGKPSFIALALGSTALIVQRTLAAGTENARLAVAALGALPHLSEQNAELRSRARELESENARLRESLASSPDAAAIARVAEREASGTPATVIGYDPENVTRSMTIDRGSSAGVRLDDGVIDAAGVVGRVVQVAPFESTVLLLIDGASKVPAVVQRGRWWGIATGTSASVRLQFVSQDARLRTGDAVVTGEGRSFRAGLAIGRIARVDHPEGALYQSALVKPAVEFGRLFHVVVLHR